MPTDPQDASLQANRRSSLTCTYVIVRACWSWASCFWPDLLGRTPNRLRHLSLTRGLHRRGVGSVGVRSREAMTARVTRDRPEESAAARHHGGRTGDRATLTLRNATTKSRSVTEARPRPRKIRPARRSERWRIAQFHTSNNQARRCCRAQHVLGVASCAD
jgi:hypothetical protein